MRSVVWYDFGIPWPSAHRKKNTTNMQFLTNLSVLSNGITPIHTFFYIYPNEQKICVCIQVKDIIDISMVILFIIQHLEATKMSMQK